MRHTLIAIVILCALAVTGGSEPAAQQPVPASASNTPPTVEEVLKAVRGDLQSNRTDMVAKNVTLTAEQAASSGRCSLPIRKNRTSSWTNS